MTYLQLKHLTFVPGSTLIAWHAADDVQAVRTADGEGRLYVGGRHVVLDLNVHMHPVQQVICYCSLNKRQQKAWLASLPGGEG